MERLLDKNEFHKVIGEIYKITNLLTNKCYIGQTRSHRLNHNKYRPFGHIGRFKDHICEATHSTKVGCKYLNSALLKYGIENFHCELLITCKIDELDDNEVKYIIDFNSKYPNGYNLTDGGQTQGYLKGKKIILDNSEIMLCSEIKPSNPNLKRSEYTKNLISKRLIEFKSNISHRKEMMVVVQKQHESKRFDKFKNIIFDDTNLDKYIHVFRNNTLGYEYVEISIGKVKTTFVGKFETIDEIKNRARIFMLDLIKWQRRQIAGTFLEPSLPLAFGNICEDHD
jgi:group I intron endonuclease